MMKWSRVRLIFHREMRDQIRDRRTMFTIFILPLLLYPFMGMMMLQIAQFHSEHTSTITIVGYENWPSDSPLVIAKELDSDKQEPGATSSASSLKKPPLSDLDKDSPQQGMQDPSSANQALAQQEVQEQESTVHEASKPAGKASVKELSRVKNLAWKQVLWEKIIKPESNQEPLEQAIEWGKDCVSNGQSEVVLVVDPSFQLWMKDVYGKQPSTKPPLTTIVNQASDHSNLTASRLRDELSNWQERMLRSKLAEVSIDPAILDFVRPDQIDIAPPETKQALVWSKLLPLIMLVWALTGAFYPAIDICAGEKERGTLETLLSSPASRREIVWGKLLTIFCFSVATAILNLFSMQLTSTFVIQQFTKLSSDGAVASMGALPITSLSWLIVILLPISMMFSALALAVAALARSSKEGQYYLMPLLLGGLPLVMLPMMPNISLSTGTAAIPVTGAVLLARALIEGQYTESLIYAPVVMFVTVSCCLLAVRWAVRQFENESVMFRESDRFQWSRWLQYMWRHRSSTATPNEAILCGTIILIALFFGRLMSAGSQLSWETIASSTIIIQLAMILFPCLLMATFMTASIRHALRIEPVKPLDFVLALMLGITLNPAYTIMMSAISNEFQIGDDTRSVLMEFDRLLASVPFWSVVFVLAIIPAICEELAFRGFIFGGLIKQNGTLRAILLSSIFFGLSHGVLQQTIGATVMGIVLGIVAWKSGGVICGLAIHMIHNSLTMYLGRMSHSEGAVPFWFNWAIVRSDEGALAYSDIWSALSVLLSIAILAYFCIKRLPKPERSTLLEDC